MIIRAIAIMAAAFLLTGCGKKTEAPPPAQPVAQPQAPAPTVQQPATPSPAAPVVTSQTKTNANAEPDLTTLSALVRVWALDHRQVPKNFEEFATSVTSAGGTIPPPPPGKKYALDGKHHVVLVNR